MTCPWASALFIVSASIGGCASETPAAAAPPQAPPASPEPALEASSPARAEPADAAAASASDKSEPNAPVEVAQASVDKNAVETRTSEVIARIVKDNRKPFRDCYEKASKDLPELKGTLTLHFVLDPEGKVKRAELNRERSTIQAPPLIECAVTVLKSMKFPASSRGMESIINYPFDFKP